MAIRIITVDRATEDHWEYARKNQFWDLKQAYRLNDGDIVVFWRGGSPGKILGQATVVGDVTALQPAPHMRGRQQTAAEASTHTGLH